MTVHTHRPLRAVVPAVCATAALIVVVTASLGGQSGAKSGEWTAYGGDPGNTRYAPLDQINAENFAKLEIAWRFKTDNLGPRPEFDFQSTPLVANGVLYSTGGSRRAVFALDAATGELRWVYSLDEGPRGEAAPRQLSGRGLSYWSDGKQERVIYVTPGYQLIALDAKTGRPIPGFGRNGLVDLKTENDQQIDPITGEVGLHATPAVTNDVIIIGAAHRTGGNPRSMTNVKGYVRGYDVRSGKRLWIFHTIPTPGEFGNETWLKDSWSYTGNTGVWGQISVDEELGLVYLPVEAATGDYFGANRPGNNLFAESLVAVEIRTGRRRWHYQLVHHGIWDHDIPCAPILVDLVVNGKPVKAVAQPTKQAFLYVFNRETGEPIWPIEERPVPKGDVPGEWYSPTQPFPLDATGKPFNYDRQGVTVDDLIDFTPELRAEAIKVASLHKMGPLFTPPVVSKAEGPLGTLMAPAAGGGTNWPGGSFDPETRILYVGSNSSLGSMGLTPPAPGQSDMAFIQGNALSGPRRTGGSGSQAGGGQRTVSPPAAPDGADSARVQAAPAAGGGGGTSVQGLPLLKPPYGIIAAIDLNKGQVIWKIPHGETPDNIRNHPALKGMNLPRTGQPGMVGILVTRTLLIAGEGSYTVTPSGARGAMLRAYNKTNGEDVAAVFMPAPQSGSPMTYMLNGRQHIVVAVSGGNYSGELLAFRLPT
jgi:quinoprotein glucose dehydrogenase